MAKSESENVKSHETQSENVKGHETLWQMKGRYADLANHAYDPILVLDLDGIIRYANLAARDLAGSLSLIGLPMRALLQPEQAKRHQKLLDNRRKGDEGVYSYQWDLISPDRTRHLVMDVRSSLLKENGKPSAVLVVARDVTDRHRLEQDLRNSEEKYRILLESAHVGIFQSTLEGRYLYANQTFLKMLGYETFAELEKKNSSIHYTDPSARKALIAKIRRSKNLYSFEKEYLTKTGHKVTHLASVSLQGNIMTGAAVDVTERKRIEKELLLKTIHLQETNMAIKVLLQQRQREVDEIRNNFLSNIRHLVEPYLKKLHSTSLSGDQRSILSIIDTNLDLIVSPFVGNLFNAHAGFTPKEVRVAALMRQEMAVKDIASVMNISASAVNLHRQNIRKKLKLTGKKVNLLTFLQSMTK